MEKQTVFIKRYPSKGELPKQDGIITLTTNYGTLSYSKTFGWVNLQNYTTKTPEWWLEEIIPAPEDPKELANIILTNAIRSLDKESAKGLVRELCERFELLPSEDEIKSKSTRKYKNPLCGLIFRKGANFILNKLKGETK